MRVVIISVLLLGAGCINTSAITPSVHQEDKNVFESLSSIPVDGNLLYKGFGEYVQDRFTGYHVGIDLEAPADTPVYAIAEGEVTYAGRVSGYGGVMVIKHDLNGRIVSAIYGHLDPTSLRSVGDVVAQKEQVGVLGEEGDETDGEREHLHFAMYEDSAVRLNGYELDEEGVYTWLNPVDELGVLFVQTARHASDLEYAQGEELFPLEFDLPEGWDIEYIPSIQSLNLYTLYGAGTARQRSQVLIRFFDASSFLTLSTVTISSTEELTVGTEHYTARRYDIEKNFGVADFVDQPSWRNGRHIVTDFRGQEGYTRYFVVAANPELDESVYETLLARMTIK